jgi:hypothetical protein
MQGSLKQGFRGWGSELHGQYRRRKSFGAEGLVVGIEKGLCLCHRQKGLQ